MHQKRNRLEGRKMRSAAQGEKSALVKELCGEGYALKYLLAAMALFDSTYCYELAKKTMFKREIVVSFEIITIFNENKGRCGVRGVHGNS